MGNPAMMSRFKPQIPVENPELKMAQPGIGAPTGIVSQMIGGIKQMPQQGGMLGQVAGNLGRAMGRPQRKPNLQKAQRMNPPEVPTRKFY